MKKYYNAVVFMPDGSVRMRHKVGNLKTFADHLKELGADYANMYDSKTREFEFQMKKDWTK